MRAVVTGAAGFIGSHLAAALDDVQVICCDPRNEKMHQPDEIIELLETQPDIDCVFHLGAISSTTETNIARLVENNILFSGQLIDTCIHLNIPIVYASSASVYGLGENGFREDAHLAPLNYYAISKVALDMLASQKMKDHPDCTIVGLRYFNVYGTGESHKGDMASPVHKFLCQAQETGEIRIFEGSENYLRDFVHVSDVVSMTLAARHFTRSGIYNVGTGGTNSFLDVAHEISKITGAKIVEIPFPAHLRGKYQEFTCSDNEKISEQGYLGDRTSLTRGILQVCHGI